jgi:hypothetical protein
MKDLFGRPALKSIERSGGLLARRRTPGESQVAPPQRGGYA